MKKLMFLTMIFGLIMFFTGSVSAQQGKVVGATGSQKITPKVGNLITLNVHQAASDNAAQGIKSGRKYYLITIFANPEGKGQQSDIVLDITADQSRKAGVKNRAKITGVENPIPEILINDKVALTDNGNGTFTLTISRGNKTFGKISGKVS